MVCMKRGGANVWWKVGESLYKKNAFAVNAKYIVSTDRCFVSLCLRVEVINFIDFILVQ